ncbi:hypothetical protein CEXT_330221 [Caerostris extrusa]|uniref:Uncharacterized protein n=1 Tax=Caerostris extrusa TaxID=172846 RepID=A0AAV4SFW6_CAEEX|nr:hypothetical protein CEXT_330221 [Caerostris extrusa]
MSGEFEKKKKKKKDDKRGAEVGKEEKEMTYLPEKPYSDTLHPLSPPPPIREGGAVPMAASSAEQVSPKYVYICTSVRFRVYANDFMLIAQ